MDTQEENTHFQDWLGEGSLPLMRGLQLAQKLQAELNGFPLLNLEEASYKSSFTQALLASLSDIVSLLIDGIHKLSSTANLPLKAQQSHEHMICGKSPNSPRISKNCKQGPRKIRDLAPLQSREKKRCPTKLNFKLCTVKEGFDDGFTWRKYGQKPIQGKSHPRSYYRCVHKGDRNCPAVKQVQECDGIANSFDITYIENHTCKGAGAHEGAHRTTSKSNIAMASSPQIVSANSHTSAAASMQVKEPLLNVAEIEVQGTSSSFATTTSTRSLLHSLLNEQEMFVPAKPLQVSCTSSLEKSNGDSTSKFPQAEQQQEESTQIYLPLPIWDFEPFPAF